MSAVAYGDGFGFIGLYIVKPEFRGKGLGMRLWEAGMAYLGDRNIGLDGVVASRPIIAARVFAWPTAMSASRARRRAAPVRRRRRVSSNCQRCLSGSWWTMTA